MRVYAIKINDTNSNKEHMTKWCVTPDEAWKAFNDYIKTYKKYQSSFSASLIDKERE